MKFVVTGVEGVIGRGVAVRLLRLGHDVVGVGSRRPESWPGSAEFISSGRYDAAVQAGVDAVVHCAQDTALLARITDGGVGRLLVVSSITGAERPPGVLVDGLLVRAGIVLGRNVDESTLAMFAADELRATPAPRLIELKM